MISMSLRRGPDSHFPFYDSMICIASKTDFPRVRQYWKHAVLEAHWRGRTRASVVITFQHVSSVLLMAAGRFPKRARRYVTVHGRVIVLIDAGPLTLRHARPRGR